MSRYYRANVEIVKPRSGRETAIADTLMKFWGFEDVVPVGDTLFSGADGHLTAGRTEEEFARELAQCVWAANQGFCKVEVGMTYLENLPTEDYVFSTQDEYDEWIKTSSAEDSGTA